MKSNVTPFFLIILAVALFYMYINPQYAEITALRAQENTYIDALDKAKQIQEIRTQLLAKYNSFSQADLERLQTLLPDNVDNVRLVLDLANLGAKYNIEIKDIRVEKPLDTQALDDTAQVKPYGQAKVTFSFNASYDDFTKYVQEIEQSLRIVDVGGITFRPGQTGNGSYTLVVTTYWLK